MALVQRDYILRLIEAVGAALARIARRRESGDLPGARRETQIAVMELLGPVAPVARNCDSRTAADLIGDSWRLAAWGLLVADDAVSATQMGQSDAARMLETRAFELLLEARIRGAELDARALAALRTLRVHVDVSALDPRYRDADRSLQSAHHNAA